MKSPSIHLVKKDKKQYAIDVLLQTDLSLMDCKIYITSLVSNRDKSITIVFILYCMICVSMIVFLIYIKYSA